RHTRSDRDWSSDVCSSDLNPATGEILAMVGSRDYFDEEHDGNVNVTLALRQPGSSIKPINYAAGLGKGIITAASPFVDKPTCFRSEERRVGKECRSRWSRD